MPLTFVFFTMLNAFWVMLFIAAPFCVKYEIEQTKSAPTKIYWKKLIVIASILAGLVTLVIYMAISNKIVEL